MDKIPVYCQFKFLDEYCKSIPPITIETLLNNPKKIKDAVDFTQMIFSNCELKMDISLKQMETQYRDNALVKKFLKCSVTGGSEINPYFKFFEKISKNQSILDQTNPRSLFLFDTDSNTVKLFRSGFGLNFINNGFAKRTIPKLFEFKTFKLSKQKENNSINNWRFIKNLTSPINAAIISDRYCLIDRSLIEENIFSLIKNILPDKLERIDFHLTIITRYLKDGKTIKDKPEPGLEHLKPLFSMIDGLIRSLNLPYKVVLSIAVSPQTKHDRVVITNYYKLSSGDSFNYFRNGRSKTDTTLSIWPFGVRVDSNHTCYSKITKQLRDYSWILKNVKGKRTFNTGYLGSLDNRLLKEFNGHN